MVVTFTPDLAVNELIFRLWANAPVPAASGAHIAVDQVTEGSNGAPLAASMSDPTTVHVALAGAADIAETVRLAFTLTVPRNNDDRVAHAGDTMRLGSFLPLLAWEPGVGWATEPATAIHGEAATSPVADYDVALTLPAGYDVLGTGVRGIDNHWRASAVRDVAFTVGHFEIAEQDVAGVHVTVGVDRSVGEDPHHDLALIAGALPNYEARFGAFPWPVYTVAMTPGFSGGIEFPLHVMQGPGSQDRSVVHELAHQWFYSLVGNDQARDPWLDESLASYAEFVQIGSLAQHANDHIAGSPGSRRRPDDVLGEPRSRLLHRVVRAGRRGGGLARRGRPGRLRAQAVRRPQRVPHRDTRGRVRVARGGVHRPGVVTGAGRVASVIRSTAPIGLRRNCSRTRSGIPTSWGARWEPGHYALGQMRHD